MDLNKITLPTAGVLLQPYMRIRNAFYKVFTKVVNVYYFNIKTLLNVKGFIGYEIYFF
jgi:hypothetical protein